MYSLKLHLGVGLVAALILAIIAVYIYARDGSLLTDDKFDTASSTAAKVLLLMLLIITAGPLGVVTGGVLWFARQAGLRARK